jgi:hypothetical protein
MRNVYKILTENPKRRGYFGELTVDNMTILSWILEKYMLTIHTAFMSLWIGTLVGSCEESN